MRPWSSSRSRPERVGAAQARADLGARAEQLAVRLLVARGYAIERRNVRYPVGEIDLIARDRGTLCFVEVRSTSSDVWGGPLASVRDGKRRRLIRAARWYLNAQAPLPAETRFDVVGITWRPAGPPRVELIQGAFMADDGSATW